MSVLDWGTLVRGDDFCYFYMADPLHILSACPDHLNFVCMSGTNIYLFMFICSGDYNLFNNNKQCANNRGYFV